MRYADNPHLLAALADAYVVGTLPTRARRRLERLFESDAGVRAAVHAAEDRWVDLSLALRPVQPSATTWDRILANLDGHAAPTARVSSPRRLPASWRMALAAGVALLALGIAWLALDQSSRPTIAASVAAQGGQQLWVVEVYGDRARLAAKVLGAVASEPGRSYELWALPQGGTPVSLGLLPEVGQVERRLTAAQRNALQSSTQVAVSLEPSGGSRTGAPTGPVLYVAELRLQPS